MNNWKLYLPYYLGRSYWTENSQGNLNAVTLPNIIDMVEQGREVQLHLRPLSSMTDQEAKELYQLIENSFLPNDSKLIGRSMGYFEQGHSIHDSVLCFRFDTYMEHPAVMDWLPAVLLQVDDEDCEVIWGRFSDAGKVLEDSVEGNQAEQFHYLLQKGFDLFNLIRDGHAVNVNEI